MKKKKDQNNYFKTEMSQTDEVLLTFKGIKKNNF